MEPNRCVMIALPRAPGVHVTLSPPPEQHFLLRLWCGVGTTVFFFSPAVYKELWMMHLGG